MPALSKRSILSQAYNGRPGCTYCGFCQAFGCHVGAKSSILVTKLPEADSTGNFKLITGAMCHRANTETAARPPSPITASTAPRNTIEVRAIVNRYWKNPGALL